MRTTLVLLLLIYSSCVNHVIEPKPSCRENGIHFKLISVNDVSPCGVNDGKLSVSAFGGNPPYEFYVNDSIHGTDGVFEGLPEETELILTVFDPFGCGADTTLSINRGMSYISINISDITADELCVGDNGKALVNVSGAIEPYILQLDGEIIDGSELINLADGMHEIVVQDSEKCTSEMQFVIPRVSTGVSWEKEIKPIIETSCAKKGCHASGAGRTEFVTYKDVKAYANQIKVRTQNRSMPFDGALGDLEIQLISCWVDDGAPNN